MTVWQIGAGDWGRDYSQLCIDHDVMMMGPGDCGPFDETTYAQVDKSYRDAIRRFSQQVQAGDFVLLRRGHQVVAIGIAADESYAWDERFDDVYGWDLQHTRRVYWQDQLETKLKTIQSKRALFADRKQVPTITRVKDRRILDPIEPLIAKATPRDELRELPSQPGAELAPDDLAEGLFSRGLSQDDVESLLNAINRQCRLLRWYREYGRDSGRPKEHEVVAYMVLPMLLALGWSEQLLAVEWHKVDLAAFRDTPSRSEACVMVCEAKGMWDGLQNALGQAENYVTNLKLTACRTIILTQGGRFYVYERNDNADWSSEPAGYVNVEKLRSRYVVPADTNAVDTLMSLTPQRILGRSN